MGVQFVIDTPSEVRYFDQEAARMDAGTAQQVAEIFQTPLTGSYNWDYRVQDDRIRKLYELGKQLNWNVETDIDWNKPRTRLTPEQRDAIVAFKGYGPYEALSEKQSRNSRSMRTSGRCPSSCTASRARCWWPRSCTSCAPTLNAKLYAASQTFDEARHVEVFNKYLQTKARHMYPSTRR